MCIMSGYKEKRSSQNCAFFEEFKSIVWMEHHQYCLITEKRYMAHKLFKPKRLHLRTLR